MIALMCIVDSIRTNSIRVTQWECIRLFFVCAGTKRSAPPEKKNSLDPSASIRNWHPRCVLLQAGYEIGSILVRIVKRAFHIGAKCIKGHERATNRIVLL